MDSFWGLGNGRGLQLGEGFVELAEGRRGLFSGLRRWRGRVMDVLKFRRVLAVLV